jgi:hypothetical protein
MAAAPAACLELGGRSPGRLLAFVHGLSSCVGLAARDTVTVVADSFDAYLHSLLIDCSSPSIHPMARGPAGASGPDVEA